MAFIDGEEKPLASFSSEALIDRLERPASSKEELIIRKILNSRGIIIPQIYNPAFSPQQDITTPKWPSVFDNHLLDPTRLMLGMDLAKDDSPSELKINVKRRNIKFNFNN